MKSVPLSTIINIGLAIFSMFFGAGNLILPLQVGLKAGTHMPWALLGFIMTAIIVPLISLVSIILFDGDYKAFFNRLGSMGGQLGILYCMLIVGPLLVMPRIINFSHIVMAPFLNNIGLIPFSAAFLLLTFLAVRKEGKILSLLGSIVSPALLTCLGIIIVKGVFFTNTTLIQPAQTAGTLLINALKTGYSTLDAIGSLLFCSMVINLLAKSTQSAQRLSSRQCALIGLQAGIVGLSLLGLVYVGLGYLGGLQGIGLEALNPAALFSTLSFRVLGSKGAIIIAIAVFMACYSTLVPLTTIFTKYVQDVTNKAFPKIYVIIATLIATGIMTSVGLDNLLKWSAPVIEITYPALITLCIVNILYKVWGFKPVKIPVAITLIVSAFCYFYTGK